MNSHTAGPWFIGHSFSFNAPAIIGDGDTVVALLPGKWNYCTEKPADASLIKEAPNLLRELERCVKLLEQEGYIPSITMVQTLRRAKGEQ